MSNHDRTNEVLATIQAAHGHKESEQLRLKVFGGGRDTIYLNITEDEARDIANILYNTDEAKP